MPSAAYQKYQCFEQDIGRQVHQLNTNTLKVSLTNRSPDPVNDSVFANIVEIPAGNGYVAGGTAVPATSYAQTAGVGKLLGGNVTVTATGGVIGPFRYAVLYNATASGGPLIAFFDYGSSVTLNNGDSILVVFDPVNGIFTLS